MRCFGRASVRWLGGGWWGVGREKDLRGGGWSGLCRCWRLQLSYLLGAIGSLHLKSKFEALER